MDRIVVTILLLVAQCSLIDAEFQCPGSSTLDAALEPVYSQIETLVSQLEAHDLTMKCTCSRNSEVPQCETPEAFGLEDRTIIPDDRFTASSTWSQTYNAASEGRLNNNRAWAPAPNQAVGAWIEVDLAEDSVVSGVVTQGDPMRPRGPWYVTQYRVAYQSLSSTVYDHVRDASGEIQVFEGNNDRDTPVTRLFSESIVAARVRIEVVRWNNWPNLRFELLGCRIN